MKLDISTYEQKLTEHDYREDVAFVLQKWSRDKLTLFLSNLCENQIDEPLPKFSDMSTEDMRKLSCLVVWNWGWDGSDYFVKMYGL